MSHNPLDLEKRFCANNYAPAPVMLVRGSGVWVYDQHDRRYLDMMSAYSAVSFGHSHPRLVAALANQAEKLAVISRAFSHDRLGPFLQRLCSMTKTDKALPMNTGAEAVETAIKAARKWGYQIKGIPRDQAKILVCDNNFHGRTTTIVGFSSHKQYREHFGPFDSGFIRIPFGDIAALRQALTPNVVAFLVEPIQGEGGVVTPPQGYLEQAAKLCREHRVLFIADEVQTGLGRTGKVLACWHEHVQPDGVILGKALGGGLLPVSALAGTNELMNVFLPGDHGSTFGGNALACRIGDEALQLLEAENLCERAEQMGQYLYEQLEALAAPEIITIRGKGLMRGILLDPKHWHARAFCQELLARGILSHDTHGNVVRLSPPLIIQPNEIDQAVAAIADVLHSRHNDKLGSGSAFAKVD